jgi:hypothetical protein
MPAGFLFLVDASFVGLICQFGSFSTILVVNY